MKKPQKVKRDARKKRHKRIRSTVFGTAQVPRFNLFRSNKGIFAQIINDENSTTIVSASENEVKAGKKNKTDIAKEVGKLVAKKAVEKKIEKVVFDRGGNRYHGRIKAVADGAREGGLKF